MSSFCCDFPGHLVVVWNLFSGSFLKDSWEQYFLNSCLSKNVAFMHEEQLDSMWNPWLILFSLNILWVLCLCLASNIAGASLILFFYEWLDCFVFVFFFLPGCSNEFFGVFKLWLFYQESLRINSSRTTFSGIYSTFYVRVKSFVSRKFSSILFLNMCCILLSRDSNYVYVGSLLPFFLYRFLYN